MGMSRFLKIIPCLRSARLLSLLVAAASVHCALADEDYVVIERDQADEDFLRQGEYAVEEDGTGAIGVQVIALGGGEFEAVVYQGGLPGAGWQGREESGEPARFPGKLDKETGQVTFGGDPVTGTLAEGGLRWLQEEESLELKRVERQSPTMGKEPPEGAVVLFDGTSADGWNGGRMTEDGLLQQGAVSKETFGDHVLHVEFLLPYRPYARGQKRGNSGIYMQGRYEVQMLDSFGLAGQHNECGGIYGVAAPILNMCLPPLQWQTYDIEFTAARFDDEGNKTANARMTVKHNGVLIHDDVEIPGATAASRLQEGPDPGPVYLQDHNNPARYRNVWVLPR